VSAETPYDAKPWLGLYDSNKLSTIIPAHENALEMFLAAVARAPDEPAILYFDGRLTYRQLDEQSGALAAALVENGFSHGDRFGIYLQNIPAFLIAILAAWKAGGIAVAINPMNREREIGILFDDCTPQALICHGSLYEAFVTRLGPATHRPRTILTTTAADYQTRNDPRLFAAVKPRYFDETLDLQKTLAKYASAAPFWFTPPAPPACRRGR